MISLLIQRLWRSRRRRRLVQVFFGLTAGLMLTELGFRIRDRGAFPHINLYVPDDKLGVRLRPGGTEKRSMKYAQ